MDDLLPIEDIRVKVFFGVSRTTFWRLRYRNKKTWPRVMGVGKLFMSEAEAVKWRNKHWNRDAV